MEILIYSLISWISILITLLVYILLWRKHNFHGWTQFAFLISAFLYFFIVFLRKLHRNWYGQQSPSGVIDRLFTFLTLVHCTNVVNLSAHIFWTFLKVEPEAPIRSIRDLSPLFKSLSICWAFPALIVIIETFSNDGTVRLLEQGVLVALISLNFVIIVITVFLIIKLAREGQKVQSANNESFEFKAMVLLFVRLFCITGVIWTVKAVPLLVLQRENDRTNGFWKVMNFLSDSYGVVIFLVFIYNKRILTDLMNYPMLRKILLCNWGQSIMKERKQLIIPDRVAFQKARKTAESSFLLRSP
ncbi:probable G-protein coupled receptor Mth-like 3 [Folsomia candida]|uniref:probable G-protein coupled receptor Mth-like 3 n=1 Tax=Folsomia candida TaxID=158441 RepID=UPI000B8F2828|nr:probable G-protein coupled receptor Mth-like 3 [Folsomia candida]